MNSLQEPFPSKVWWVCNSSKCQKAENQLVLLYVAMHSQTLSHVVIFEALVGYHDILILGKSPIKWRQHPDMTLAVGWDVKHKFKQTNKHVYESNDIPLMV